MCVVLSPTNNSFVVIVLTSQEGEKYVKKVKGIICFSVTKGPGGKSVKWLIDLKSGKGSVEVNSACE